MHEHQRRVLELLAHHDRVRFSDLERFFDLRSNKLSYHLNQLQENNLVEKSDGKYRLTGPGKAVAPYLGTEQQPLTVALVAPVKDEEVLLVKRQKEVYRGMYALPSKTLAYGDAPAQTLEQLQDRYGLELDHIQYRKTVIEIDEDEEQERQHHFIFLVYTATPRNTPDGMRFFDIHELEKQDTVIPTDARIVQTLDQAGLDVMRMDIGDEPELQE